MKHEYPILEYDKTAEAMIEPHKLLSPIPEIPKQCVLCFFHDVIKHLREQQELTESTTLRTEMGDHPVYAFQHNKWKRV